MSDGAEITGGYELPDLGPLEEQQELLTVVSSSASGNYLLLVILHISTPIIISTLQNKGFFLYCITGVD